jgi:peptidoglycan/LPS O-acetylase OafA/YrhL
MQGIYRLVLALMVVIHHLAPETVSFAGRFAVLGFYCLSGYLITGAVERNYGADLASLKRFGMNRFLRLFPCYWAVLAIAIFAVLTFPSIAAQINPVMRNPSSMGMAGLGWIPQFTMVGLQVPPATLWPVRLIPPAWSTCIEIYFYFAIALCSVLGDRAFGRVFIATIISGFACALTGTMQWAYTSVLGVAVLFAAGSYAYRRREQLGAWLANTGSAVPVALLFYLALAFAPDLYPVLRDELYIAWGQYAAVPVVAILAHVTVSAGKENALTEWFADLSYPVFLAHFPVSVLVAAAGFSGWNWVWASTAATLVIAAMLVAFVERPVAGLRKQFRASPPPVRAP